VAVATAVDLERRQVIEWRYQELRQNGCPPPIASLLAKRTDLELERMRRALDAGCAPSVLADIML
jgi:hypothetical protein